MYGGLKGTYGLRNPTSFGEWSPTNLGSPSPNDYAGVMREIDQFNKLTREANHQTMIIEDEILELQQKIYNLEVDSQKAKEDMIKRMISNDVVRQPPQPVAAKVRPSGFPLPHTKPPIDNRSRGNTSSLHTLIKDSIRTLPGVTEFVKNSELLERFRKSYARDLQEYYKMNSSNLQRELIEKSDTPGLSSYSEAVSQLYNQHSAAKPPIVAGSIAAHLHNQTIKEADEQDEDGRLNHTSKDTSRPNSVVSGRPKEHKEPRDHKTIRDMQLPQSHQGAIKKPDEWDEKFEKELEEKMESKLLLRRNANSTSTPQSKKDAEDASKPAVSGKLDQESVSRGGTPQTQENRWLAKAGNIQKGQTNITHKTTSLREEDYATNFGQNDSDSGEPTPKTRTIQDHRSVDHQDDGLMEDVKDFSKPRYGTTNLLDSGKKVKTDVVSPLSTKRLATRIEDTPSPNPQQFQTLQTLTASHKKEETITFKPHEVNSHSGKKAGSERFTGNSELDPRRLGDEFTVPQPRGQQSKFAVDGGLKKPAEGKTPNHVYKDSCFDDSDLQIDEDIDDADHRDKPQNSFHQNERPMISESELKKVKREFEQIIEANKTTNPNRGDRTEQGRKVPHHDENLILEEDFGPELLTNPDMVGDGTKSQAIRFSKPLQDGSSLDYSHTRRFTEEGFRSNTDQQYGTSTLQSRRLGLGNQPKPDATVPSKMLSDLSAKNDRLLEGTGVSQWKTPTGPTGSQFRIGISAEPEANSPISLQILDRERHILPGEIEKNYGFGASDVSLIKKKSEQREPPEDSRLEMFKDSAIGYEEYLERLKADASGAKHKTALEPIEEKTVPKQPNKQASQVSQPHYPSRRTGTVASGLLESEVSPRITGSGASKIIQSHKDSGVVVNSGYPRTLPDSRAEQYIPFDEELIVDDDVPDSQLRGVSDALGKSSSKETRTLLPIGAKMANSLDDLEEYIEGSASNLPYSVHSGQYSRPSGVNSRTSRDTGAAGSELNDDVYIDEHFDRQPSANQDREAKSSTQGHSMSSHLEEEELSLSIGTKHPQAIFKNKLAKQVQRTNRYTGD